MKACGREAQDVSGGDSHNYTAHPRDHLMTPQDEVEEKRESCRPDTHASETRPCLLCAHGNGVVGGMVDKMGY